MYRFYCKVCKKVKRVTSSKRVIDLENGTNFDPSTRIGTCKRHTDIKIHRIVKVKPAKVEPIKQPTKRGKK